MPKIKVAVIFGGTNTEHEVSMVSARGIIDNLDQSKYEILPIKITKENKWITAKEIQATYQAVIPDKIISAEDSINSLDRVVDSSKIDVVFPILHGPYGEDGTIQGMLELMRLPYVGCGVTASAVCMDKVIQKNICQTYNIIVPNYISFTTSEWGKNRGEILAKIITKFKETFPLFVKPVNQGSSVGITKAHSSEELERGIDLAATRDLKIIVEECIANVREIECSLLGTNDDPECSVLGEIIPGNEFYDYDDKYLGTGSKAVIPADLPDDLTKSIQATAKLAFKVLDCHGMARIDFLLDDATGTAYLSEVNTIPGFTPISMYPKLWEASGLNYPSLLDRLIELAIVRYKQKSSLNLSR